MAPPKKKRNSDRNSDLKLVTPKHGRGALLARGKLGNKGGGRIPSAIRELCRVSFAERLDVLTDIADDTEAKAVDRIRAIDLLGKFGGVAELALTTDEQPTTGELTSEHVADLWEKMERIKSIKGFEKMMINAAKKQSASGEE